MISIRDGDLIGLVNVTEREDFYGIHEHARSLGKPAHQARQDGNLSALLEPIVTGAKAYRRSDIVTDLKDCEHYDGMPLLQKLSAEMLEETGLDLLVACHMASLLDGPLEFLCDGQPLATVNVPEEIQDEFCEVIGHLGDGVFLDSAGFLTLDALPASLLAGMGAIPDVTSAEDIVAHPLLRRWNVMLGECEAGVGRATFEASWTSVFLTLDQVEKSG